MLIVLVFILIGAFRGIIRTLLNLIGLALNAFISYWIARPLAQGIYDGFIKQELITKIQTAIAQHGVNFAVDSAFNSMPDWLAKAVGLSEKLSGQNFEQIARGIKLSDDATLSMAQSVENVLGPVLVSIIAVIATFVLFMVFMILIKLLIRLIIKALDGPVLRTVDRVFGAVLGGIEGAVLVFFLCVVFNINLFA